MVVESDLRGGVVIGDHLDDASLLELIAESEVQARQAERRKLRYALAWAERHLVADEGAAALWSDADSRDIERGSAHREPDVVAIAATSTVPAPGPRRPDTCSRSTGGESSLAADQLSDA